MRQDLPALRGLRLLYGLAGGLLLLGLLLGRRGEPDRNRIPRPLRMLSSALVLLAAVLQARAARDRQLGLVAAGMGCGFVGDLIMARLIPLPEHVLFGMLSFGVGHGCYMRALAERARAEQLNDPATRRVALGGAWLVGALGWWGLARNPQRSAVINYAALGYALLLASMAGAASALAAQRRRYARVALGGWLFLLSDLILAAELFRGAHFRQIGDVVWLTYISGQALIVDGMGE